MGEKRGYFFSHSTHEPVYPLVLAVGCPLEKLIPMSRVFDLLVAAEGSRMAGDLPLADHNLHVVGVGKQGCRHAGILRGNGVTVRVELDEGGFPDSSRDHPVGSIGDSRKGEERFLHQCRCGRPVCGPVDSLVSLLPPEVCLSVEITDVDKVMCLDEASEIPYHSFDASFLIGPSRGAGMDGEAKMARCVEELGVERKLRSSFDDHALKILCSAARYVGQAAEDSYLRPFGSSLPNITVPFTANRAS